MGRVINKDPIGLDGDHNLYAFVGNNPMNSCDMIIKHWLALGENRRVICNGKDVTEVYI